MALEMITGMEFNKYCAGVMEYKIETDWPALFVYFPDMETAQLYDPYDDLNQMTDVIETLIDYDRKFFDHVSNEISSHGVKQAFRNYISYRSDIK